MRACEQMRSQWRSMAAYRRRAASSSPNSENWSSTTSRCSTPSGASPCGRCVPALPGPLLASMWSVLRQSGTPSLSCPAWQRAHACMAATEHVDVAQMPLVCMRCHAVRRLAKWSFMFPAMPMAEGPSRSWTFLWLPVSACCVP